MRNTEDLPLITDRLRRVQIECAPASRVLERYCAPDSLAYCDPPYVAGTRRAGEYMEECTDADHEALIALMLRLPGRFLLSGYDHPIYAPLEAAGWGRIDFDAHAFAAGRIRASGLQGPGSCAHQRRTETLWLDPQTAAEVLPAAQQRLQLAPAAG
jgi:DNA adenine methylase